jgi:hypothetical protein
MKKNRAALALAFLTLAIIAPTFAEANQGDFDGGVAIGSSYAGTDTAPTNGLIVQGDVGIGTSAPTTGAALDLGSNTNSMLLPTGTTGQRPTGVAGMMRYNSTSQAVEAYYNGAWNSLSLAGSSTLVNRVSTTTGAVATGSTGIPVNDTVPTTSDGDQYMSLSITPQNANDILKVHVMFYGACSVGCQIVGMIFQDSNTTALATCPQIWDVGNDMFELVCDWSLTAGTTSATTLKFYVGNSSAATVTFNGISGSRRYGGSIASGMWIEEYTH